jgi:hypothetical protein
VIAGAGHAVTWEAPAEFNRVVLEFLELVGSDTTADSRGGGV